MGRDRLGCWIVFGRVGFPRFFVWIGFFFFFFFARLRGVSLVGLCEESGGGEGCVWRLDKAKGGGGV